MALYNILHMVLRGAALIFMLLSLYFNWEAIDLSSTPYFMMSGIFGALAIVTLGLLMEAGLDKNSDAFIEVSILVCGILLNLLASILAFIDYYDPMTPNAGTAANKGFLAVIGAAIYVLDLTFVSC